MADIGGGYRSPSFRIEITLLSAAIALFLLAMLGVWFSQYETRRSNVWVEQAISLREVADELAVIGSTAGNGATPAFDKITPLLRSGDEAITSLRDGNAARGISPLAGSSREPLTEVEQSWLLSKRHAQGMASRQSTWVSAASAVAGVEAAARDALGRYESSVEWLARNNAPAPQLLLVAGQLTRLERITSLSQSVLKGSGGLAASLRQLDSEVQSFTRSNQILMGKGPDELRMGMLEVQNAELRGLLGAIDADFQAAAAGVSQARSLSDELTALQSAAAALAPAAAQLSDLVSELNSQVMMGSESGQTRSLFIYGTGLAAVALLIGFILMSFRNAKKRQRELEERDSRQQGAILNLLDEITNLSDGDLTVDVTVTEDFTGAIADSINYTVDTLRRLVGTINNTSVEIAAAATSTQDTAQKMNQASERQAREITNVTTIIAQTAESLTQMAARAEQISQDAAVSVDVAHNGAVTVGRTIQGMTAVREQIQETAKRIKRLGESSQEIGNIIEFINDISDQTNTLALNASIQAAMAGEAGRGFAVVADEVQRLAERAGSATRQIETLVKTIQADTAEAIISMERSTSTVVTGARNAEEAGQALTRIESTSTEVARLIQDIAAAARSQSAQATRIAGQMQAIRDIAVQTSGSSGQTARAVGELTTLSEKLRESVAGFKLPADVALMTSIDLSSAA